MINLGDSILNIEDFLGSSEIIGVLIGQSSIGQLHCGIAYKFYNKFNAIHLAWHFHLLHEENSNSFMKFLWVKSSIHKIRQNSIAAMCRRILKRQNDQKIPYGLLYSGGSFTKEGLLKLDSKESGLTCATFVMAVFNSCEINLIDIDNWESRDSDKEWHNQIIYLLKETKNRFDISETHIENVSNEAGCSRFRPEEVAISTLFKNLPARSNEIIEYGSKLRYLLLTMK